MRMHFLRAFGLALLIGSGFLLAGCAEFFSGPPDEDPAPELRFLFALTGGSGSFSAEPGGAHALVTLNDLSPVATYFLDYPLGVSSAIPSQSLFGAVDLSGSRPPEGALVLSDPANENQDVIIGALISTEYDAANNAARYRIRIETADHQHQGDESKDPFHQLDHRKDLSLPGTFGGFALFISADHCSPLVCEL